MTFLQRVLPLLSNLTGSAAPASSITAPYSESERTVIRALANGDQAYREEAIAIYHSHLRAGAFHKDPYYEFMGEITSPCPCWIVKGRARSLITGKPFP